MNLDRFVDTPAKRRCAFLLLTASLLLIGAIQNLKLGLTIQLVKQYEELFELLASKTLSGSYLSRCIYEVISQASITPWTIGKAVIGSLRFFEYSWLLVTGCFLMIRFKHGKSQRWLYAGLISYVILILLCAWCIAQGLSAVSLNMVIDQLHVISMLLIVQSIFQILMGLCAVYVCIMHEYLPAMKITVEYIEE